MKLGLSASKAKARKLRFCPSATNQLDKLSKTGEALTLRMVRLTSIVVIDSPSLTLKGIVYSPAWK